MISSVVRGLSNGVLAACFIALSAGSAIGQETQGEMDQAQTSEAGPFQKRFPAAAELLNAFEAGHGLIHGALITREDAAPETVDTQVYDRLVREFVANPDWSATTAEESMSAFMDWSPQVAEIMHRTSELRRELYDIYADEGQANQYQMAEAAVDRYLNQFDLALPSDPKSMDIMTDMEYSGAFKERYPRLNGIMWAYHWLQLAAFEPLMRYDRPEKRQAAMAAVVARFWDMLEDPPETFPTQMPMSPTIAPFLTSYHPGAAAIFDNLNMLHDVTADVLVSDVVEDRQAQMTAAVSDFRNPSYMSARWYDWVRMAILHGIGNQGGWATEFMPRPERTEVDMEGEHERHFVLPGMPPR